MPKNKNIRTSIDQNGLKIYINCRMIFHLIKRVRFYCKIDYYLIHDVTNVSVKEQYKHEYIDV